MPLGRLWSSRQLLPRALSNNNMMMMMMIDFTSGGVSTKYRPDRACHPHFSHGAAYEGF